jgi:hypothetical protein
MKKVAVLILNRNLPNVTEKLYRKIKKNNGNLVDIFVIDSGSLKNNISKLTTWKADWKSAKAKGLRYGRGMNFGLSQLWKEKKFKKYDAFLLLTNDIEFSNYKFISKLIRIMNKHKKIGILSPCSKNWGEKIYLKKDKTKYFWFIHNACYLLRREFIEDIANIKKPNFLNFLFDGSNFRGYGIESELIAKAYMNGWSAAITSEVWAEENESYLKNFSKEIRTENFSKNLDLYLKEGLQWMKNKYGFNNKWQMQFYVKMYYDDFFEFNPELKKYRI